MFACVGNDDDLRSVMLGADGAFAGMEQRRDLRRPHHRFGRGRARAPRRRRKKRGVGFVDAPVSGGQAGAENGELTVMCGGERGRSTRAKPVIAAYARRRAR